MASEHVLVYTGKFYFQKYFKILNYLVSYGYFFFYYRKHIQNNTEMSVRLKHYVLNFFSCPTQ